MVPADVHSSPENELDASRASARRGRGTRTAHFALGDVVWEGKRMVVTKPLMWVWCDAESTKSWELMDAWELTRQRAVSRGWSRVCRGTVISSWELFQPACL